MIVFRRALARDGPAVRQLCAGAAGMPDALRRRLRTGEIHVVEVSGAVVGCVHIEQVAAGEFWLSGLRVDPAQRGRGLATPFAHYQVDVARTLGARVVRLATSPTNEAVRHIWGSRIGAREVGYIRRLGPADVSGQVGRLRPASPSDGARIAWLLGRLLGARRLPHLVVADREPLAYVGLTREKLLDQVRRGRVLAYAGPESDPPAVDGLIPLAWRPTRPELLCAAELLSHSERLLPNMAAAFRRYALAWRFTPRVSTCLDGLVADPAHRDLTWIVYEHLLT